MPTRVRLPLPVLFWVFVFATISFAVKDPELEQCKHQCGHQRQFTKQQAEECEDKCEIYYKEKKRREQEGSEGHSQPYVFQDQDFDTKLRTDHGSFRLLPKFTEKSKLLKGIESYRVSVLEVNPQTFVIPNHWDTECIFFVANGRGTISLIREDERESFNLRHGDVLRVRAGTSFYLINADEHEKFVAVHLLQPVSTPGEYWPFFDGAGEEPESYFRAFSIQLLEAAFNTNKDMLERIFKQQKEGVFLKASREQIKAMTKEEEGSMRPSGGESKGVFNLFNRCPSHENQYGKLFEVEPNDWKELQQLDVALSFANITQGSMAAPFYNSKATTIAMVIKVEGYFEMACPHLASSHSSTGSSEQGYQRVSSRLKSGMVYIVPPGHPVITVASQHQNLQLLCFVVNAQQGNKRIPLAGMRNVYSQLEREAKELSFNAKAEEVDEVFQSQGEDFFFKGPYHQRQEEEEKEEEVGGTYRLTVRVFFPVVCSLLSFFYSK